MTCNSREAPSLVDAHFAGTVSPSGERRLREHLPLCESCREKYDRHLLLAELDPAAKTSRERLQIGLGLDGRPKALRAMPFALALSAAVALLAVVVPLRQGTDDFLARGGATSALDPKVLAYRIEPGQPPRTLKNVMRAGDELAFAYANPGGYQKLMIFAVDEHRHLYWYHPEWSNRADDPHAIPIAAGPDVREIPAAVGHAFDGNTLTLFAVFSNADLTVRQVEQMVESRRSLDDAFPLKNGVVKKVQLSVEH